MTVQEGKPATLTCVVSKGFTQWQLQWYKQNAGDILKIITSLRTHVNPTFGPGFHLSRFEITNCGNEFSLMILKTINEDKLNEDEDKFSKIPQIFRVCLFFGFFFFFEWSAIFPNRYVLREDLKNNVTISGLNLCLTSNMMPKKIGVH